MSGSKRSFPSASKRPGNIIINIGDMTVVPAKSGAGEVGKKKNSQISYCRKQTVKKAKVVPRTNNKSVTARKLKDVKKEKVVTRTNQKSVTATKVKDVKKQKLVTRTNRKSVTTATNQLQFKNGTCGCGTMSEYKQSQTVRFGNRNGYTEVYNEQRVRNVKYDDDRYAYVCDSESDSDSDVSDSGCYAYDSDSDSESDSESDSDSDSDCYTYGSDSDYYSN